MKRIAVRTLALLLCVILCVGLLPVCAFADEEPEAEAAQEEVEVPAEEPTEEEEAAEEPAEEEAAEEPEEEPAEEEAEAEPEAPAEEPEAEAEEPAEEPTVTAEPAEEEEEEAEVFTDEGVGYMNANSAGSLGLKVVIAGSDSDYEVREIDWNAKTTLKVKATVNSGALTYQWYKVNEKDIDFDAGEFVYRAENAISGATSTKYTTPALHSAKAFYYTCSVTDKKGAHATALFCIYPYYDTPDISLASGNSGVDVSWSEVSWISGEDSSLTGFNEGPKIYAAKYQVYRKASGGEWAALKTVKSLRYTDTTAKMGTKYAYKVRAYINGAWTPFGTGQTITFNPFTDVSEDMTEFKSIAWAYNNGIVKGTSDTTFSPDASLTRAQFVMMLWKMNGSPTVSGVKNPFTDVSGDKTVKAVLWALQKGIIVKGTEFHPTDSISRIQVIMILWKLAGSPKVSAKNPFTDVSGSKTVKAMNWAYSKKIQGTSSTAFSPSADCSRAQMTYFMYKTK